MLADILSGRRSIWERRGVRHVRTLFASAGEGRAGLSGRIRCHQVPAQCRSSRGPSAGATPRSRRRRSACSIWCRCGRPISLRSQRSVTARGRVPGARPRTASSTTGCKSARARSWETWARLSPSSRAIADWLTSPDAIRAAQPSACASKRATRGTSNLPGGKPLFRCSWSRRMTSTILPLEEAMEMNLLARLLFRESNARGQRGPVKGWPAPATRIAPHRRCGWHAMSHPRGIAAAVPQGLAALMKLGAAHVRASRVLSATLARNIAITAIARRRRSRSASASPVPAGDHQRADALEDVRRRDSRWPPCGTSPAGSGSRGSAIEDRNSAANISGKMPCTASPEPGPEGDEGADAAESERDRGGRARAITSAPATPDWMLAAGRSARRPGRSMAWIRPEREHAGELAHEQRDAAAAA